MGTRGRSAPESGRHPDHDDVCGRGLTETLAPRLGGRRDSLLFFPGHVGDAACVVHGLAPVSDVGLRRAGIHCKIARNLLPCWVLDKETPVVGNRRRRALPCVRDILPRRHLVVLRNDRVLHHVLRARGSL